MEERISMSTKDLSRFEILTQVKNKQLKKGRAARLLGISPRQVRRLLKRLVSEGPKGLISRRLGAPSNNQVAEDQEKLVLGFHRNKDHHDFGLTLTHEYLVEEGAPKKLNQKFAKEPLSPATALWLDSVVLIFRI